MSRIREWQELVSAPNSKQRITSIPSSLYFHPFIIIMTSSKLITVFGATGSQGGSVVQSLLQNKSQSFKIRGITRNTDSEKARALASQGVEVVKADGLLKQEVLEAFKGSWGVFVNTNSDDPVSQSGQQPNSS